MTTPILGPEMRTMRRELAAAPDAQVLAVLRLVEAMPDRGAADSLLAPLRARLRVLRPVRPLRFSRLLFLPLDPVIVPPNEWRPEQPLLPRSAIAPLTELIRYALPAQTEAVEQSIAHQTSTDRAAIARQGALLWPEAARVLRRAVMPASWRSCGLRPDDFPSLSQAVAAVLAVAPDLAGLEDSSLPAGELNAALAALLDAAAALGAIAWGMLLAILLQRFPQAAAPASAAAAAASRADRPLRHAAETAQAHGLRWVEEAPNLPVMGDLDDVVAVVRRQVTMLTSCGADPSQRHRATTLAAALRDNLTSQMDAGVQLRLVDRLTALPKGQPQDGVLDAMEEDARALRRLELEIRRLGGPTAPATFRRAADAVIARTDLDAMDRARLVEILLGAQDAAKLVANRAGVCP